MDWRHRAACLDEDPELFFPIGNTGPAILQIDEAKAVCRRCDVVDTCLKWAIESGQDAGVWNRTRNSHTATSRPMKPICGSVTKSANAPAPDRFPKSPASLPAGCRPA